MIAGVACAALADSLWQAPAIAAFVWLWLRALRGCSPATRAAAWTTAAAASLVLPVATAFAQVKIDAATDRVFSIGAPVAAALIPLRSIPSPHEFVVYGRVALAVAAIWCCVSAVLLARLVADVVILERIKREAMPLDVAGRARMPRFAAANKGVRGVRLCTSAEIDVPMAVGLFDALIALPETLADRLDADEIDRIALHELSHIRRRDDWQRLAMRTVAALLWFNPAIYFIVGQAELEREVTCDDAALAGESAPEPYVTSLVKLARTLQRDRPTAATPGIFDTRRALSVRIERALERATYVVPNHTALALGGILAAATLCFFVARAVAPTIAFASVMTDGIRAPLRAGETIASRSALLAILDGFSRGVINPRELGAVSPSRDDRKIVDGIAATMSQLGAPIDLRLRTLHREAGHRLFEYRVRYERNDVDYLIWLDSHDKVSGASFNFTQPHKP